jgi:SAM-dependent methyltransferase
MNITEDVQKIINDLLLNWSETERTVEIPFIFRELPEPGVFMSKRILDIGCCESPLAIKLNDLWFDSWGVDVRDYGVDYPKFIKCDARNLSMIPSSSFDMVMAVSTIEHIGLVSTPYNSNNCIDSTFDEDGDLKVISEMVRVVKPGGMILVTLPYGTGCAELNSWMRFYNKNRIQKMVNRKLVIDKIEYYIFRNGRWSASDEKECSSSYSKIVNIPKLSPVTGNICILGHKA